MESNNSSDSIYTKPTFLQLCFVPDVCPFDSEESVNEIKLGTSDVVATVSCCWVTVSDGLLYVFVCCCNGTDGINGCSFGTL